MVNARSRTEDGCGYKCALTPCVSFENGICCCEGFVLLTRGNDQQGFSKNCARRHYPRFRVPFLGCFRRAERLQAAGGSAGNIQGAMPWQPPEVYFGTRDHQQSTDIHRLLLSCRYSADQNIRFHSVCPTDLLHCTSVLDITDAKAANQGDISKAYIIYIMKGISPQHAGN